MKDKDHVINKGKDQDRIDKDSDKNNIENGKEVGIVIREKEKEKIIVTTEDIREIDTLKRKKCKWLKNKNKRKGKKKNKDKKGKNKDKGKESINSMPVNIMKSHPKIVAIKKDTIEMKMKIHMKMMGSLKKRKIKNSIGKNKLDNYSNMIHPPKSIEKEIERAFSKAMLVECWRKIVLVRNTEGFSSNRICAGKCNKKEKEDNAKGKDNLRDHGKNKEDDLISVWHIFNVC
jgi:hypothetical protein